MSNPLQKDTNRGTFPHSSRSLKQGGQRDYFCFADLYVTRRRNHMASKASPPEGLEVEKETIIPMPAKVRGAQAKKYDGLIDYSMVDGTNLFAPPNPDNPLLASLKPLKKAGLVRVSADMGPEKGTGNMRAVASTSRKESG